MGAGRRAVEYAWSTDDLMAISLTGSLLELDWQAFSQFALPPFLKACTRILSQPHNDNVLLIQTLRVLSRAAADGVLKTTDTTLSHALMDFVMRFLSCFTVSEESVRLLNSV